MIFIRKIELDCLPVTTKQIQSLTMKFGEMEVVVQTQVPVVNGHVLLTNILFQVPIQKF